MLATAVLLAGCGSSASNSSTSSSSPSNASKIEAAEASSESQTAIEEKLINALELKTSNYSVGSFKVGGGECTVDLVATGSKAAEYKEDTWTVFSPNGSAAVKVIPTGNTPESECLKPVAAALHWEQ